LATEAKAYYDQIDLLTQLGLMRPEARDRKAGGGDWPRPATIDHRLAPATSKATRQQP
jgi:hypothetical protein